MGGHNSRTETSSCVLGDGHKRKGCPRVGLEEHEAIELGISHEVRLAASHRTHEFVGKST